MRWYAVELSYYLACVEVDHPGGIRIGEVDLDRFLDRLDDLQAFQHDLEVLEELLHRRKFRHGCDLKVQCIV